MQSNFTAQFRDAIAAAGLTPPEEVIADGKLRRFASNGKRSDLAGWYVLHDGNIPAGAFGDWRSGVDETWCANIGRQWTAAEQQAHRAKVAEAARLREAEEHRIRAEAGKRAAAIWDGARPAPDNHEYLRRKAVRAHGLRVHDDGRLIVPLRDTDGALHSLQFIAGDGAKRFLPGGRVAGCYHMLGEPDCAGALCLSEGFATGSTIHEATGYPVVICFNAGNVLPVSQALRSKYPERPIVICGDDDWRTDGNPGLTKAREAAQAIAARLAVPSFGADRQEGDTDFNDMARLRGIEAVRLAIEQAEALEGEAQAEARQEAPSAGNGEADAKQSVAKKLVLIGEKAELFHDDRRDGYAVVKHDGVHMTVRLRGRDFKRWLGRQYWQQHQSAPNNEAIQTALNVLEATAVFEGRCLTLSNRFACRDGAIFVDLADPKWRVAKVTAGGWTLLDTRPALFRRYSHQRPLPAPERGGSLDELRDFLNVKSDEDWLLLRAWLVTAALEDIPRPIVTFHGAQGSGKSTAARVLRSLLDPSAVDNLSFPKKHDELALVLDHHALPCFDNLKSVDSASADMLCRAVTGGGLSKRELFTDAEDVILSFKRAVLLNGINVPTHAPDLLDRMLLIELERIPEDRRRTEAALWSDFDAAHPRLFGALLDGVSGMLKACQQAQKSPRGLPRMADFATWGMHWSHGAGIGAGVFLDAYSRNIGRQTEEAIESDDVAVAVRELAAGGRWEGTPAELLATLNALRGSAPAPDGWPRNARSLGRRLRVLQTTLAQVGVRVTFPPLGKKRGIAVQGIPEKTSETKKTSEANSGAGFSADVSQNKTSEAWDKTSAPLAEDGSTDVSRGAADVSKNKTSAPEANNDGTSDVSGVSGVSSGSSVGASPGAREVF